MTTLNQATEAIYQHFIDSGIGGSIVVVFDGETYQPVEGTSWLRASIRHINSFQNTLGAPGNRNFERQASFNAQIFTPVDSGRKAADLLAQSVRDIFEGVSLSGIYFFQSSVKEGLTDGVWYSIVVNNFFTYNETK